MQTAHSSLIRCHTKEKPGGAVFHRLRAFFKISDFPHLPLCQHIDHDLGR